MTKDETLTWAFEQIEKGSLREKQLASAWREAVEICFRLQAELDELKNDQTNRST